jgi:amino acid adenylation domain-containing protein
VISAVDAAQPAAARAHETGARVPFDLVTPLDGHVAAQVQRTPHAIALSDARDRITYQQMWQRADALAVALVEQGVGRHDVVGVCAERSVNLPIALLAILRCGAAYCPLEPDQPTARMRHILEQAHPTVVLSAPMFAEDVQNAATALPNSRVITAGDGGVLGPMARGVEESVRHVRPGHDPQDRAYVIFTSGSTGRPKGVMVPHRGIVNRLLWMQRAFTLADDDVVLQKTPYGFDVSVWELFWPLLAGARMHLLEPDGHRDPRCLTDCIRREQVTTVHFVPSMLALFLEDPLSADCPSLRRVISSGEALPANVMVRALSILKPATLWNLYGPTETSVDVTCWQCQAQPPTAVVPIGRPVANVDCYVFDEHGERVPDGSVGELCIGGVQVALGYIGQPELTAEHFVDVPGIDGVVYRSGDLVRRDANGLLQYIGRSDSQVKLNGVRIELGEVESVLRELPGVSDGTVILDRRPGHDRLVAYAVAPELLGSERKIRAWLASRLPASMVPAMVMLLERMPVTSNGKLDRAALPPPGTARRRREQ